MADANQNINNFSLEDLRIFAQQQLDANTQLTQEKLTLEAANKSLQDQIADNNKDFQDQSEKLKKANAKITELKQQLKALPKDASNATSDNNTEGEDGNEYHEFELGEKKYKWNIVGRARFMALDNWSTPDAIMAMQDTAKRDAILTELVDKHPTIFTEQFSA